MKKYAWTFLLFAACFVFWGFLHPEMLFYHEYYQMFLFTGDYFWERLSVPGGLSDYIGEFLTQFFVFPVLGAFIIASLTAALQLLTDKVFKVFSVKESLWPLTFLPPVALWAFMNDSNLMPCFLVSVIFSYLIFILNDRIRNYVFQLVVVSVFYWLIGPAVIIAALFTALRILKTQKFKAAGILLIPLVVAWVCSRFVSYPESFFWVGVDYIRFPGKSYLHLTMFLLCPLLPFLSAKINKEISKRGGLILAVSVAALSLVWIVKSVDRVAVQSIRMYQLVYEENWDGAVKFYEKHLTPNSYSVQCLNLALAEKGLLPERMFHYYQPGLTGLTSSFETDMFSSLISGEICYRLGAVNVAQRYAFECQVNISNFRHSSKLFVRLAQTAIINHEYEIAKKYLFELTKTLFYKEKALIYLGLLDGRHRPEEFPEFAAVFKNKLETDGALEEMRLDVVLKNLLQKNPENYLAVQFFQAYAMLNMNYHEIIQSLDYIIAAKVKYLSKHVQEALTYFYYMQHKTLKGIPNGVSPEVLFAFERKNLENTFWKYVVFMEKHRKK